MDQWFEHLTEQISLVSDEQGAAKALGKLAVEAGFNSFTYLSLSSATCNVISNYASEWQQRYHEKSYIHVDPIMRGLRQRDSAFAWSAPTSRAPKECRQFFSEAAEFGVRSGLTIPIVAGFGQVAILTLASEEIGFAESRAFNPIRAAGAMGQLHARLQALRIRPKLQIPFRLKAEELTCLRWSSEGKSMDAIATIEGISYSTVAFHIHNAKQALGASSVNHATSIAKDLGLF